MSLGSDSETKCTTFPHFTQILHPSIIFVIIVNKIYKYLGTIVSTPNPFRTNNILHKIGFFKILNKLIPDKLCIKICCNTTKVTQNPQTNLVQPTAPGTYMELQPTSQNTYINLCTINETIYC